MQRALRKTRVTNEVGKDSLLLNVVNCHILSHPYGRVFLLFDARGYRRTNQGNKAPRHGAAFVKHSRDILSKAYASTGGYQMKKSKDMLSTSF